MGCEVDGDDFMSSLSTGRDVDRKVGLDGICTGCEHGVRDRIR